MAVCRHASVARLCVYLCVWVRLAAQWNGKHLSFNWPTERRLFARLRCLESALSMTFPLAPLSPFTFIRCRFFFCFLIVVMSSCSRSLLCPRSSHRFLSILFHSFVRLASASKPIAHLKIEKDYICLRLRESWQQSKCVLWLFMAACAVPLPFC